MLETLNPNQFPGAARRYCELSDDIYCSKHLESWLDANGRALETYYYWLVFRLASDRTELVNIPCEPDFSIFDNLNALG